MNWTTIGQGIKSGYEKVGFQNVVIIIFCIALGVCLLGCNDAQAADRTITCDPPTTRDDGTPFDAATEVANYEWWIDGTMDGTSTACSYVLTRPDGDYNVQAKTVDTGGRVSQASPGKQFTVTTANPNPPSNLQ